MEGIFGSDQSTNRVIVTIPQFSSWLPCGSGNGDRPLEDKLLQTS